MAKLKKMNVRLSTDIKPERYQITVRPDLEAFTFQGEEAIFLNIKKSSKQVTLHSKQLDITTAEFVHKDKTLWAGKISYDNKADTATISFSKPIPKGKGELRLVFRGILSEGLQGYYRSKYIHDGKEKFLATTQFEATDARRAFPCFDEPSHKAVFDISMVVPSNHVAISNTLPSRVTEHEAGYKTVQFEPTPKMSTYLLAFISGEFEYIEGKTKTGVLIRIFTTPGKKHQAEFGLQCAIKSLEFYEKYFDIPYPMPVLDMIAIPDFAAGAMENWGAITYREAQFLVDPNHSSAITKQWAAITIAHELVHQWFGNLVTMEWWTHLWLNESFAAYIEYLAVDHIFPEWDMWTQFQYLDAGAAMSLDGLKNTHPIEVEVHHPEEIGEIFDAISYQKGSSMLRMLAEFLGEKDFRNGLRDYLKKHAYKNATSDDLWKALEQASGKPVRKIMKGWVTQAGYPTVTVVDDGKKLYLSQSRFFSSSISRREAKDKSVWPIPFNYAPLNSARKKQFLFDTKTATLPKPAGAKSLKFNLGETGFYLVDYPVDYIPDLKQAIAGLKLPPRDRLGILANVFALAESGQFLTAEALNLLSSYKKEKDYTVWLEIMSLVRQFGRLIIDEPYYEAYRAFARELYTPIAKHIGWTKKPNEKHTDSLLRGAMLYQFANYGDEQTIERAQQYFWQFVQGKRNISPDFRGFIYQTMGDYGGKKEFDTLLELHATEQLTEEKLRLSRALGLFRNSNLISKTLTFAFSKHVRAQDAYGILASVWVNPKGRDKAWEFMKANWAMLLERYGQGGHMLSRFVELTELHNSEEAAHDMERFFKTHQTPGADRAVQQALEKVRSNATWLKRERDNIGDWLGHA